MPRIATRARILAPARRLLARGGTPTVAQLASAAGVSKASFYRAFESRGALLEELDVTPQPGPRERILAAALDMVGTRGLAALSMDELADRASVSRATLYRLFPGKSALFTSLLREFSPLEPVIKLVTAREAEPPRIVMPELARTVYRTLFGHRESRVGLVRALFFEVSALGPDTEEAAEHAARTVIGTLARYLTAHMSAGRLRRMPALLALQAFVGPIFFHLMTRPMAERFMQLDVEGERAVIELAHIWLRGMAPA